MSFKLSFYLTAYKNRALRENPDKIFYLAWDLLPKDNPSFHHRVYYSYEMVKGANKLRTPQINNITLKVYYLGKSNLENSMFETPQVLSATPIPTFKPGTKYSNL